jgi:hypothetical protein
MTRRLIVLAAMSAVLGAGCYDLRRQSDNPVTPSSSAQQMAGTWISTASTPISLQDSCTNFTWEVTEMIGNTGRGTFSALCFGNMQVVGTAQGTINGSLITWTATATGTVAGQPPCAISLQGTADLSGEQIRIPFTGNTCFGPIGGTEVLRRR